nr:uncharacterized protein LOC109182641 [Ipomoea trifida]
MTALGGIDDPKTMKFRGQVASTKVIIMVDSSASHNFISHRLSSKLQYPLEPTQQFGVKLGDGRRVESKGKYSQLPVNLGPVTMALDCFVFPLGGVDMILGVAWLETLGNIKANWARMTMTFKVGDRLIQLSGDPSLSRLPVSINALENPNDFTNRRLRRLTGSRGRRRPQPTTTAQRVSSAATGDGEYLLLNSPSALLRETARHRRRVHDQPAPVLRNRDRCKMTSPSVNYCGSAIGINVEYDFDSEMPSPEQQPEPKSPSIEEVEQPNSEEPKPKRAKSTTFDVWESFTKIGMVDGKEKAKCNGCGKEYTFGGIRYGTSSLLRHIPKCVALPKYHNIGTMMLDAQGKLRSRQLDHKRLQEVMAMAVI